MSSESEKPKVVAAAIETTSIQYSASRTLMVEQHQKAVGLSLPDMQRLRGRIVAIREPIQWVRNLGWASFAVAPAALLGWVPWIAAYDALPEDARIRFAWVTPTLLLVAFFAVALAVVCYFMNRSLQLEITHDKQSALDVIDAIAERHGLTTGFGEDSSPR